MIEGLGEREDTSLAHPPESGLHADAAAEGGGDPYRTGTVGTKRSVAKTRCYGSTRAATRATGSTPILGPPSSGG